MLGGGNPVGGSLTGPAQALEIVGNRCYAYSGNHQTTNTEELTFLEFTTGNFIADLKVQYGSGTTSGVDVKARVYLNDSNLIALVHNVNFDENHDAKIPMRLILPTYTKFKFTLQGQSTQTSDWTVWINGRIHRMRV